MKLKVVVGLVMLILSSSDIAYAQLSRTQVKKNNRRLWTHQGRIRNQYGLGKYSTVGLTLGTVNYYGDLSPTQKRLSTDISFTRPGFGMNYTKRVSQRFVLDASYLFATLSGSDAKSADQNDPNNGIFRYQRNLSFRNRIHELSGNVVIDLFETDGFITRVPLSPYLFVGVGVIHHNPKAQVPSMDLQGQPFPNAGHWVALRNLGTEGQYSQLRATDANFNNKPYHLFQAVIPAGIGARLRLNDFLDLSAEISVRYLFTDYIDDVSKNYVDLGVFSRNELAKALSYRTNELATPTYAYISERDGIVYNVVAGYGSEYPTNIRGNKKDNDVYTAFLFRLSYGFAKFSRPKSRG